MTKNEKKILKIQYSMERPFVSNKMNKYNIKKTNYVLTVFFLLIIDTA